MHPKNRRSSQDTLVCGIITLCRLRYLVKQIINICINIIQFTIVQCLSKITLSVVWLWAWNKTPFSYPNCLETQGCYCLGFANCSYPTLKLRSTLFLLLFLLLIIVPLSVITLHSFREERKWNENNERSSVLGCICLKENNPLSLF